MFELLEEVQTAALSEQFCFFVIFGDGSPPCPQELAGSYLLQT
jgi:hypothetical protein